MQVTAWIILWIITLWAAYSMGRIDGKWYVIENLPLTILAQLGPDIVGKEED